MDLQGEILKALKARYKFRKTGGAWLQEGECPDCGKWELFCSATSPKIVKCGKENNCGYSDSVRNLLPDLFEDWSKRFESTETDPNAAADAYLQHERGLDLSGLRGSYTQETYKDFNSGATGATVRFKLPNDTYWERIIDRPGRFGKKAHFQKGGSWRGHCWIHPQDDFAALAAMDEIWVEEGIMDAAATRQAFKDRDIKRGAVSAMSVNVFPDKFFENLRKAIADGDRPNHKPVIVWAFDVGPAGVAYTRKFVARLEAEDWPTKAAQVKPDGEGSKQDWNDLWLRQMDWKGEERYAPFSENAIEGYLYNGAITVAKTPQEKARLILERTVWSTADFHHGNKMWFARMTAATEFEPAHLIVTEVCNCSFRLLYREYEPVDDEGFYFIEMRFPKKGRVEKARFSASACATNGEFKKRMMTFGVSWSGTQEQLDSIIKRQVSDLKTVQPIDFTGYSKPHKTWVLGDIAVHQGRVIPINREQYFDIGKTAIKRKANQNLLDIDYDADKINFDWLNDIWAAWGEKGLVAFAFFNMSAFAVQIREKHKSLGFLEVTGEPGAGKSTLMESLWQSFGRSGYEGQDPNKGTVAWLARSMMGVSNLPVGLIEGNRDSEKKSHGRQFDWNELLTLYNGRSPRGTARKTSGNEVSDQPFFGSVYLMQNDPIDAMPAVLERIMTMNIDKASWTEETTAAARRIEAMPMDLMSGTLVHIIRQEANYLPFFFDRFEQHNSAMRDRVDGLHNARCVKCHSQLAAAVEALPSLFPAIRPDCVKSTLKFVDAMALNRQVTAGGDHPLIAEFWEKVEFILRAEDADRHEKGTSLNKSRKPDELIAINLPQFEQAVSQALLRPLDMNQLKRLLRNSQSRKFIETKNVNSPSGKVFPCWVFEQPKSDERII